MKKLNLENAPHQVVEAYNEIVNTPRYKNWIRYDETLFESYFPSGVGQHRDSDDLQESNFSTAIELLKKAGCEEEVDYKVCLSTCSMVGWQEGIYVHKDSHAAMVMAEINIQLENYPVLDDDDYSERQWNSTMQGWNEWGHSEFVEWVANYYNVDEDEEVVIDGEPHILEDVLPKDVVCGEYDSMEGYQTTFDYKATLEQVQMPDRYNGYEGLWAKLQIWLKGAGADEDMLDQG